MSALHPLFQSALATFGGCSEPIADMKRADRDWAREDAILGETKQRLCDSSAVLAAMYEGDESIMRTLADLISQAAREQSDEDYTYAQRRALAATMMDSILEVMRGAIRDQVAKEAGK